MQELDESSGSDSSDMRTFVIREASALRLLRPAWETLLDEALNAGTYQSPTWLLAWFDRYATSGEIYVIAVEEHGLLVGLAPFTRSGVFPRGGPQRLVSAGAEHLADGDPLVRSGDPRVARAIADHLCESVRRGLTVVSVRNLRHDSPFYRALSDRSDVSVVHPPSTAETPVVDFTVVDDPAKMLDKAARSQRLPRRLRRLEEAHGEVQFVIDDDVESVLTDMKSMLRARWRSGEGPPLFADDDREQFTRSVYRALVDEGRAYVGVLSAGGRRVAVQLVTVVGGRHVCENIAYDPDLRKFALGHVVLHNVLEHSLAAGAAQVDLRTPRSDYKDSWATAWVMQSDLTVMRGGLVGSLAMRAGALRQSVLRTRRKLRRRYRAARAK